MADLRTMKWSPQAAIASGALLVACVASWNPVLQTAAVTSPGPFNLNQVSIEATNRNTRSNQDTNQTASDDLSSAKGDSAKFPVASNADEARARALLLHDSIHGALQVMHRDFFDDEESRVLPSQSLDDVFVTLNQKYNVQMRWLTIDGDELNVHHRPESDFEREAVAAIAKGAEQHSVVLEDRLEYVGRIRLANQCLKCHVRQRTSLEDRSAGLAISIPIQAKK
ncbi:MAG: DUF3365 domain-containing protein [Pirellulaceae bacterium]|nr:DUF3365 domain-containing protein [Pirellulaceae bacterium]